MPESNVNLTLDTVRKNRVSIIYAVEHDYGARFLTVTLVHDGKKITVEKNSAVTVNALRPDGESAAFEGTVNADGTVKVPIVQWMLEFEGEVTCSVSIVTSSSRLTTTHFYLEVQNSVWDGVSAPAEDDPNKDVILSIIAAENVRVASENARISAENARLVNEAKRSNNENERVADEEIRVSNELGRVSAEENRRNEFATWEIELGKISAFDKRIENLEAAVSTGLVTPTVDDSVAYTKDVPTGALPNAMITEVGGMTYNDNGILKDAKVTAVESVGVNIWDEEWTTQTINENKVVGNKNRIYVKPSTRYFVCAPNAVANGVRFYDVDGNYISITYPSANTSFTTPSNCVAITFRMTSVYGETYNHDICINEYNTAVNGKYYPYFKNTIEIPEAVQALDGYGQGISKEYHNKIVLDPAEGVKKYHQICAKRAYETGDEALENVITDGSTETVYVMDEAIETDISDYFGDDNLIGVEAGGTITAVNEYGYDVPSVIEYTVKGSDVT